MINMSKTKMISITSGKGGVGKTTTAANLALALAGLKQKVLIFDADLGMSNVDLFFGTKAPHHFGQALSGEKEIEQIIFPVHQNVDLISGGHGVAELQALNPFERHSILTSLENLSLSYDWIVVDTSPGISENVLHINSAADEIFIVLTPDPASFADSYALIKLVNQKYKSKNFNLIVNQVKSQQEGLQLFVRFDEVVNKFLNVRLSYAGTVPYDVNLKSSQIQSRLIMKQDPKSISSLAFQEIAKDLVQDQTQFRRSPEKSSFWGQVVGVA
jgi:flagellar biosynthesis protein FlhG